MGHTDNFNSFSILFKALFAIALFSSLFPGSNAQFSTPSGDLLADIFTCYTQTTELACPSIEGNGDAINDVITLQPDCEYFLESPEVQNANYKCSWSFQIAGNEDSFVRVETSPLGLSTDKNCQDNINISNVFGADGELTNASTSAACDLVNMDRTWDSHGNNVTIDFTRDALRPQESFLIYVTGKVGSRQAPR